MKAKTKKMTNKREREVVSFTNRLPQLSQRMGQLKILININQMTTNCSHLKRFTMENGSQTVTNCSGLKTVAKNEYKDWKAKREFCRIKKIIRN
jgi:hypothetical protein